MSINLLPTFEAKNKKGYMVSSLKGTEGMVPLKIELTLQKDPIVNEIEELIAGNRNEGIEITKDKLVDVKIWVSDIKLPNLQDTEKITIKSLPQRTKIDIRFENGTEFLDLDVEKYTSRKKIEVHLHINDGTLIFSMAVDISSKIEVPLDKIISKEIQWEGKFEKFGNLKKAVDFFDFLKNLFQGQKVDIYHESNGPYSVKFPQTKNILEESNYFLNYFYALQTIEKKYNIRFSDILMSEINPSIVSDVMIIKDVCNQGYADVYYDQALEITLRENYTDEDLKQFERLEHYSIEIKKCVPTIINLHGKTLDLGYVNISPRNPYISNMEDIQKRISNVIRIMSKDKKIRVSYSPSAESKEKNNEN